MIGSLVLLWSVAAVSNAPVSMNFVMAGGDAVWLRPGEVTDCYLELFYDNTQELESNDGIWGIHYPLGEHKVSLQFEVDTQGPEHDMAEKVIVWTQTPGWEVFPSVEYILDGETFAFCVQPVLG